MPFMKTPTTPNFISTILILLIFIALVRIWVPNLHHLFTPYNHQAAHQIYTHSQYNLDNAPFHGNIDDDLLHVYAGYNYILGSDPSSINFEVPFTLKYLYGLSILIFGNAYPVQLIFSLILLLLTFLLGRRLNLSTPSSLVATLLLSLDQLFIDQSTATMLDLPQAAFIILSLLCFSAYLRSTNHPRHLIFTGVALGLVATTKLFITALILCLSLLIVIKPSLSKLIKLCLPVLAVYLLSFMVFFFYHPHPQAFIDLHLSIAKLYRSYLPDYPPFELLRIIFTGRWLTWWGQGIIAVDSWTPLWPLTFISLTTTFILSYSKRHLLALALSLFSLLYLTSNLFHVVFPRYLMSVLPLMYLSLLYSLEKGFNHVHRYRRQRSQRPPKSRQ